MRNLLLALALVLTGAPVVFADGIPTVVDQITNARRTRTVFNDSGAAITSGSVVVWDNDDTEFDRSGFPYITVTTTADSPYTAGVMATGACADQQLCEIVVEGPAQVLTADSTDGTAEDTLVGTTTVSGQVGDFAAGANTCYLGVDLEDTVAANLDSELHWVFVQIGCL